MHSSSGAMATSHLEREEKSCLPRKRRGRFDARSADASTKNWVAIFSYNDALLHQVLFEVSCQYAQLNNT